MTLRKTRQKKSAHKNIVALHKLNRETIVAAFKQPGEKKQQALIRTIAESGQDGLALLSDLLQSDKSISVRRWAIEALGYFSGKQVQHLLAAALHDSAMSVRLHAIRAVERVGSLSLARKLLALMRDDSGGIRINCLDAIVALRVPGYKSVLMTALNDEKDYVRKRARYYLDNFGT